MAVTPPPARSVEVIDLASPGMDVDNDEVIAMAPVAPDLDSSPFSYLRDIMQKRKVLPDGDRFEARVKVRTQEIVAAPAAASLRQCQGSLLDNISCS
jgi:hypothetical protein